MELLKIQLKYKINMNQKKYVAENVDEQATIILDNVE